MENFSSISKSTSRNHFINEMISRTGLPEEQVERLFESFKNQSQNGTLAEINERFDAFLKPKVFDFENFKKVILSFNQKLTNPILNDIEREKVSDELIYLVNKMLSSNVDKHTLMEVISFILTVKGDFSEIQQKINLGLNTQKLFENEKINFSQLNVCNENIQKVNLQNAKSTVKLYESLRDILARNEKHWGFNYHLDNAYTAIMEYLNKEIIELTNLENIVSIANNFHADIINEFLKGREINPMYRSADNLKKIVPDIQTLVFDLMVLINDYVANNRPTMAFVAREKVIGYDEATKSLFAAISNSKKASQVLYFPSADDVKEMSELNKGDILNNFRVDFAKFDLYSYPVTLNIALNMLHLIKACSGEFNLKIRHILNVYITKALELLVSTEKRVIQKRNSNPYN